MKRAAPDSPLPALKPGAPAEERSSTKVAAPEHQAVAGQKRLINGLYRVVEGGAGAGVHLSPDAVVPSRTLGLQSDLVVRRITHNAALLQAGARTMTSDPSAQALDLLEASAEAALEAGVSGPHFLEAAAMVWRAACPKNPTAAQPAHAAATDEAGLAGSQLRLANPSLTMPTEAQEPAAGAGEDGAHAHALPTRRDLKDQPGLGRGPHGCPQGAGVDMPASVGSVSEGRSAAETHEGGARAGGPGRGAHSHHVPLKRLGSAAHDDRGDR